MVAAAVLALAAAAPCAAQDARVVVAHSPQAVTGRVEAVAGERFTLAVEHAKPGIGFGERIEVVRAGLAPVHVGDLVGLALRPDGARWRAGRCDGYPSARLSQAIEGHDPCPAPRVACASPTPALRGSHATTTCAPAAGIAWSSGSREARAGGVVHARRDRPRRGGRWSCGRRLWVRRPRGVCGAARRLLHHRGEAALGWRGRWRSSSAAGEPLRRMVASGAPGPKSDHDGR
jgi:hypothetical protein